MCVHVNSLPDDCLLPIFDRISLLELLQLDRICHRWANLLPSAALRRRSLVLLLGGRRIDQVYFSIPFNSTFEMSFNGVQPFYDLSVAEREASLTVPFLVPQNVTFDEFLLDADESDGFFDMLYHTEEEEEEDFTELSRFHRARLTGQLVAYFTDLLPNVVTLVVIHTHCYESELYSLIDLLRSSWSLVTLKLWLHFSVDIDGAYEDRPDQHPVRNLLQSINQQSSLQHLTLDMDADFDLLPRKFAIPSQFYSFIAQLKVAQFFLGDYDCDNLIWDTVHLFGHPELRQISFGNYPKALNEGLMEKALNRQFEFPPKVRQLYWDMRFEWVEQFDEFCWRFHSLTLLRMDWTKNITFARLVSNLNSLKQLTHLRLDIFTESHPLELFTLLDDQVEGGGGDEEPRRASLPQIKILDWIIVSRSHHEFESFCPLIFPSVEVVSLRTFPSGYSHCSTCGPQVINGVYDVEVDRRCQGLLVRSLKNKFPSVRFYALRYGLRQILDLAYVDWSNYVDGDDDDDQLEEV